MEGFEIIDGFEYLADMARSVVRLPDSDTPPDRLFIDATEDSIATAEKEMQRKVDLTRTLGYTKSKERASAILDYTSVETLLIATAANKLPKEKAKEGDDLVDVFTPGEIRLSLRKKAGVVMDEIDIMFDHYNFPDDAHIHGRIPSRFNNVDMSVSSVQERLTRHFHLLKALRGGLRRTSGVRPGLPDTKSHDRGRVK